MFLLTYVFKYNANLMDIEKNFEEHSPKLSKVVREVKNNELKEFYEKTYFKDV